MDKKVLFIINDGLADRPIKELGNKTPLEAAKKPNLDKLAEKSITGIMDPIAIGIVPGSDTSHLSIFGYDPQKYYTGRGPFEVAGVGMELKKGDVAFRANLGTVDENLTVKDRRAGRIETTIGLVEEFNGMEIDGITFLIRPATGYRAGLIMRGKGLSHMIGENDPHEVGKKILGIKPLDNSKEAKKTAAALQKFTEKVAQGLNNNKINKERIKNGKLPANYLLVRGAGFHEEVPPFNEKYGFKACCIAGAGLYKGIAKILGMELINVPGATGLVNTDVKAKIKSAINALKEYDFVFVHIKPTDSLGEDGKAIEKKEFVEKIDAAMEPLLNLNETLIVITSDHTTPCEMKNHSGDPVPIMMHGSGVRADDTKTFGERSCAKGGMGRIKGLDLMNEILNITGKAHKYGA